MLSMLHSLLLLLSEPSICMYVLFEDGAQTEE